MSENNLSTDQINNNVESPTIYRSVQQSVSSVNENPMIYRSSEQVEANKAKKKRRVLKELLNLLIILVVIVVLVFGILYAVKEAAGYEAIGALTDVMFEELIYIWERIIRA